MDTHSESEQLLLHQFRLVWGDAGIKTNVSIQDRYITIRCYMCHFWKQFAIQEMLFLSVGKVSLLPAAVG